jgi:ribonuclease P protein component
VGLPQANRLKHRREFQAVYRQGSRYDSEHLTMRSLFKSSTVPTQIGITISQKVSKKAVIRNRIKRRIRAIFRELLPQISPGWKVVVIVKPKAVTCEYIDFLQELKQLLVKTKIINGH